jgi:hypothetical protein
MPQDIQTTDNQTANNFAEFEGPIKKIIAESESEDNADRTRLYALAVKHDKYFRNLQDVAPEFDKSTGVLKYTSVGKDDEAGDDIQRRTINKVKGDGKKFISVLGQKAPNIKGIPGDPRKEEDKAAARMADVGQNILRVQWDVEQRNMLLAKTLWTSGTGFGYVRYVTDGERFGFRSEPKLELADTELEPAAYRCTNCGMESDNPTEAQIGGGDTGLDIETVKVCPNCGQPLGEEDRQPPVTTQIAQQAGEEKFENGRVVLTLASVLHVRVPFYATDIADCPYLCYEYEESKARLLALYGDTLREKLKKAAETQASGGTSQDGKQARQSRISLTGTAGDRSKSLLTYARWWIRPMLYELLEDEGQRQQLYANYPEGVKVTMVEGHVVAMDAEKMDDHWSFCPAETSEFIYSDAICGDMIDFQDAVNDAATIALETFKRGLPITVIDPALVDPKALRDQPALPGDFLVAKTGGMDISKGIQTVSTARFPEQLQPFVDGLENSTREVTGVMPQIFGGGEGSLTATEYTRRATQALQQLGMQWLYMRRFWVKTYENGVRELAKYAVDNITAPPTPGSMAGLEVETLDFSVLNGGEWHFESDEAVPQNWGQQREQLLFLVGQAPDIAASLDVMHPANRSAVKDLLGLSMLVSPGENQKNKVMEAIQQLLMESPIPGPMGPEPSIPPDDFEDDPAQVVDIIRAWCLDEAGRKARKDNPEGYENVRAYGLAYRSMAQAMMAPPPEEGGPAGPAEPPAGLPPPEGNPMLDEPVDDAMSMPEAA